MPTDVIMPALGMAQETGKLLRWIRAEGETVTKGDPIFEVETDKVTVDVEAPADGTLAGFCAGEGDDVPVGQPVALILAPGESAPAQAPVAPVVVNGAVTQTDDSHAAAPVSVASEPALAGAPARRPLASPKARRLAQSRGVSVAAIVGSGPNGAVVAADVERHGDGGANGDGATLQRAATAPGAPIEVGSVWRAMAQHTQRSWQEVPHFFLVRDVDATRLDGWRDSVRARGDETVTHTDLLVRLAAESLRRHPRVNASWHDGTIVSNADVNVGIAVAADEGLVVPVVHHADELELPQIAERRRAIVAAARDRTLKPDDVSGGTFTISNLGMFGVDAFLAIVNAPQAAILSVGRIAQRAVVVDGNVVARPTLTLGLSFDHRVVDGAAGARFLDTLASLVEEPAGLVR